MDEEKQNKTRTELFFEWLSMTTLKILSYKSAAIAIGIIFAATAGIAISSIALVLAEESIVRIVQAIKSIYQ